MIPTTVTSVVTWYPQTFLFDANGGGRSASNNYILFMDTRLNPMLIEYHFISITVYKGHVRG